MAAKERLTSTTPCALSIDLGNGFTKFTRTQLSKNDSSIEFMSFPSFVTPSQGKSGIVASSGLQKLDVVTVAVDNIKYRVGPDSITAASGRASRVPVESFYRSREYQALFKGALAYMDLPPEVNTIDMLGFGLPLTVFSDDELRASVIARIKGRHEIPLLDGSGTRTIEVKRVDLQPQLVGSLIAIASERDQLSNLGSTTNLVIDAGYGTLLWMVAQGLKPQIARCGGNRGGVSSMLQACADSIDPQLATDPRILGRIDDAIRDKTKLVISGEEVDLEKHMPVVHEQVARNLRELEDSVGQIASIDNIYLVGGGAHLYREAVGELCRGRPVLMTAGNSQITNLTGFQIHAEHVLESSQHATI